MLLRCAITKILLEIKLAALGAGVMAKPMSNAAGSVP